MSSEVRFYNTLSRQVEGFHPMSPPVVRLYVCGPTVYDEAHLGHARCYITWDVLYRFLRFAGYDVQYVRNITDVDDKILNRAREQGSDPRDLAKHYTERFDAVMQALHVDRPWNQPKATDYVPQMITFIQTLLEKGMAYQTPSGTVYYDTQKKPDYGNLCHQNLADLQSGARVEVDPEKKSPLDFALWKPAPQGEPLVWEAPWGWGRPGWHIECSAMSYSLLGEQLDIHAGGMDLIFPHHQNEIAQSEAFTGKAPFVKYWMHNGFVNVSGEKMSKSLGNFSTVEQVLARYDANTIRYFLLTHHYRSPVDFNAEALEGAENRVKKILFHLETWLLPEIDLTYDAAVEKMQETQAALRELTQQGGSPEQAWQQAVLDWYDAMANDLNTPQALAALDKLLNLQIDFLTASAPLLDREEKYQVLYVFLAVSDLMGFDFLGFLAEDPLEKEVATLRAILNAAEQTLYEDLCKHLPYQEGTWPFLQVEADWSARKLIREILERRYQLRHYKNWAASDRIRDQLAAVGVQVKDRKDGSPVWYYEPPKATASP